MATLNKQKSGFLANVVPHEWKRQGNGKKSGISNHKYYNFALYKFYP